MEQDGENQPRRAALEEHLAPAWRYLVPPKNKNKTAELFTIFKQLTNNILNHLVEESHSDIISSWVYAWIMRFCRNAQTHRL